jgi:DNA-binding transcriptional LysR family regulator
MTFDQVLVFHEIVKLGSFKSAAAALYRTQPAISFSIKKLEEEMDVELFDRSLYRPTLTAHGRAFFERSQKVLQDMTELEHLSRSFRNQEEPEISVVLDAISPLPKLLQLFRRFSDQYLNTKFNLEFEILNEAERRVVQKESQIGITHFISDTNTLEVVPITTVKMIPVMSRELFKVKKVRAQSDLLKIDQVVVSGKSSTTEKSFGLLDGGKKWRISDINVKREIILGGLGWGHLVEHHISREIQEKKLVILDFEDIHPRDLSINLIRHRRHQFGVVAKALWENLIFLSAKGGRR